MAVSMNSIGNYNAYGLSAGKNNKTELKNSVAAQSDNLNNEEKKFFADMYPSCKSEIMDYHYYEKSGRMNGISVGTNIDKRG